MTTTSHETKPAFSAKPRWRVAYDESLDVVEAGFIAGRAALALRCLARDSGGTQCTADAEPRHGHRFDVSDLPGGFIPADTGMDYCGLCSTCRCGGVR